jgi:TPP-dependent pyruvate/acetoin dehydrogenase alpha subunit
MILEGSPMPTASAQATSGGTSLAGDRDLALRSLGTMWKIRRFEEAVDELFARGLMHGTMHLSIGQEAAATGACLALRPDDLITSTHRGHGHCIAKGADLNRMMAELLAKDTGYCRGRGGSMHIADVATGNLGANGIVAGGIPIAVGAALAQRMRGTDRITVSFFGDGAANEGACHEAMNMAAIWKLPVVLLCENNRYGMSFSTDRAFAVKEISERAAAYGMPGVTVDGNDVEAVHAAVRDAAERARTGEGPTFVEAVTYRWKGHSKSDKNLYRTRQEIEEWRARDPIPRFEREAIAAGTVDEADAEQARAAATQAIRAAVQTGLSAPDAQPDALLDAVYAGSTR